MYCSGCREMIVFDLWLFSKCKRFIVFFGVGYFVIIKFCELVNDYK